MKKFEKYFLPKNTVDVEESSKYFQVAIIDTLPNPAKATDASLLLAGIQSDY